MAVEKVLISPEEAAQMLSVHRATIYRLMRRHELPAVRIGRAVRIPAAALHEWVQAGQEREAALKTPW